MAKMIAILDEQESCEWCPLNYDDICCTISRAEINNEHRPDNCLLIPEEEYREKIKSEEDK